MTANEAKVVAKARAFALDHEVEDGERDGGLSEGDPSSGLSQEPGHGTAVIKDDRVPDGNGAMRTCSSLWGERSRGGFARRGSANSRRVSEILRVGSWSKTGRLGGEGGRLRWLMDSSRIAYGSRTKRSGSRARAQRPWRGTRSMPLCSNVHNALATDPCQEHARMACDSDAGARHPWGLTDARTACRRVERTVRRGAQGPRPRGKVTVPGCAMAARAARSR